MNERNPAFPYTEINGFKETEKNAEKARVLLEEWAAKRKTYYKDKENETFTFDIEDSKTFFSNFLACIPKEDTPEFAYFINNIFSAVPVISREDQTEFTKRLQEYLLENAYEALIEVYGPLCRDIADTARQIVDEEDHEIYRQSITSLETPNLGEHIVSSEIHFLILVMYFDGDIDEVTHILKKILVGDQENLDKNILNIAKKILFGLGVTLYKLPITDSGTLIEAKRNIDATEKSIRNNQAFLEIINISNDLSEEEKTRLIESLQRAHHNTSKTDRHMKFVRDGAFFDKQKLVSFYSINSPDEILDFNDPQSNKTYIFFPFDVSTQDITERIIITIRILAEAIIRNRKKLESLYKKHQKIIDAFTARGLKKSSKKEYTLPPTMSAMMEGVFSLKDVIVQLLHTPEIQNIIQNEGTDKALDQLIKERLPSRIAGIIPMGIFGPMNFKGAKMMQMVEVDKTPKDKTKIRLSCPMRRTSKTEKKTGRMTPSHYLLAAGPMQFPSDTDLEGTDPSLKREIGFMKSFKARQPPLGQIYPKELSIARTEDTRIGCPVSRQDSKTEQDGIDALSNAFLHIYNRLKTN